MIIGAQKCGTTSLAHQLAQHPEVCFSIQKEPQYFSKTKDWKQSLRKYSRLFDPKPGQLCGEASTSYTFLPEYLHTYTRLHAYNPQLKLIYIIRHPIERIISQYAHDVLRGRVKTSFEEEVLSNSIYVNRSRYGMQIEPYFELFPRENIFLLVFEEFIINKKDTLAQIAQFLEISPKGFEGIDTSTQNASAIGGHLKLFPGITLAKNLFYQLPPGWRRAIQHTIKNSAHRFFYNVSDTKPELDDSLRNKLWHMLEDDIKKMESFMGRPLIAIREK